MNSLAHRLALNLTIPSVVALLSACGAAPDATSGSAGLPGQPIAAAGPEIPCSQEPDLKGMSDDRVLPTSGLGLAAGRYVLPSSAAPTQLVVMFHGHQNDSCSWRNHLRQAADHGAIAVAMDYTGQRQTPWADYGWFAREGAADSIAAAKYFLAKYPSITTVIAFGVSMGGNVSGVAVASPDATRPDGSYLWDYWVDIEGVNDLTEEYFIARAVAQSGNEGGIEAQQEIEEENGGAFEDNPLAYEEITNVALVQGMAGLKGAVVVNAMDDGLVPTNQSEEMAAALTGVAVPVHSYKVFLNGGAEDGTTATSIPAGPVAGAAGQTYTSPFAGHGWEASDTQLVMVTGLNALWDLLAGNAVTQDYTPVPGN